MSEGLTGEIILTLEADGRGVGVPRTKVRHLMGRNSNTGLASTRRTPGPPVLRTEAGLNTCCTLDTATYPNGRKFSDDKLAQIHPDDVHGEWN